LPKNQFKMPNQNILSLQACISINKNISHVFNFFANLSNDKLWRSEINESILNGSLQKGVEVAEYSNLSKKASNNLMELVCTAFEENKLAIFETKPNAPFYLKTERKVKSINEQETEVWYTLEFDTNIVKHAMGFGLPMFLIKWKANSDLKKYLKQLKSYLEAGS
jgi:hypothetical protein